jgi:hypothetical protein
MICPDLKQFNQCLNDFFIKIQNMSCQQYRAWSDYKYVLAGLALYCWQDQSPSVQGLRLKKIIIKMFKLSSQLYKVKDQI